LDGGAVIRRGFDTHHPVALLSLIIFKSLWSIVSRDELSTLLFSEVAINSVILVLAAVLVGRITRSHATVAICLLLYGTSAWPVTYYFMYCSAPLGALLVLIVLALLAGEHARPEKRNSYLAAAGIVSGLLFWSVPHASIAIAASLATLILLRRGAALGSTRVSLVIYGLPFLCTASLFAVPSGRALLFHLHDNIATYHYTDALHKFGFVPCAPSFTFFRIGYLYNAPLFVVFIILSCGCALMLACKKYRPLLFSPPWKVVLSLFAFIWLGALAIGILPFTKLGRTYFMLYPPLVISVISFFYLVLMQCPSPCRQYAARVCVVGIIFVVTVNVSLCRAILRVRTALPEYLRTLPQGNSLYVLAEDPHGWWIARWLNEFHIQSLGIRDLEEAVTSGREAALIIGPHGRGSGMSIMGHSVMDDFLTGGLMDRYFMKRAKRATLPYYVYFPPFLMEEEISQGLYFMGKTPDYRRDSMNITLIRFGQCPATPKTLFPAAGNSCATPLQ
jgi:hypothetical protein